jgi:hypothetical protein
MAFVWRKRLKYKVTFHAANALFSASTARFNASKAAASVPAMAPLFAATDRHSPYPQYSSTSVVLSRLKGWPHIGQLKVDFMACRLRRHLKRRRRRSEQLPSGLDGSDVQPVNVFRVNQASLQVGSRQSRYD